MRNTKSEPTQRDGVRTHRKEFIHKPKRDASRDTSSASTLILGLTPLECGKVHSVV